MKENSRQLRRRFPAKLLLAVLPACLAVGQGEQEQEQARPKITKLGILLSRETTYITGPLNEDGTVDYVGSLRKDVPEDIPLKDNAARLIFKAFGPPKHKTPQQIKRLEKSLGLDLPEDGEYFSSYKEALDSFNSAMGKPWLSPQYPKVAKWLEANRESLRLIKIAVEKPYYRVPLVAGLEQGQQSARMTDIVLPSIAKHRAAARALCIRSMLHIGQDDYEEASDDVLTIYRFARCIETEGPTLIEGIVVIAMEAIGSHAQIRFIREAQGREALLKRHLLALGKTLPKTSILQRVGLGQRFLVLDKIQQMAAHPSREWPEIVWPALMERRKFAWLKDLGDKPVEWNDSLRKVNRYFDDIIALMRGDLSAEQEKCLKEDFQQRFSQMSESTRPKQIRRRLNQLKKQAPGHQAIGLADLIADALIVSHMRPEWRTVYVALQDRRQLRWNLCQTALALQIYQARRGKYPEKLADLTPGVLPKVPVDPFAKDDQPLRYKSDGKTAVVYSVGADGKDNGGTDLRFTAEADEDADAGYRLGPGTRVYDEE